MLTLILSKSGYKIKKRRRKHKFSKLSSNHVSSQLSTRSIPRIILFPKYALQYAIPKINMLCNLMLFENEVKAAVR